MISGWKYESYGLISNTAPHLHANLSIIENGVKRIRYGENMISPLYAKWTDSFDIGNETPWWYVIKDDRFDISMLKSKRRYEINKGNNNFESKVIDPRMYLVEINQVREKLFAQYPVEYRPINNSDKVINLYNNVQNNDNWVTIAAFFREDNSFQGYLDINIREGYIDFVRMCVNPDYEKLGINFSLVYTMLMNCEEYIKKGYYVCDGQRSVRHKTEFQNWLIKYFGFRKAYCRLNIQYSKLGRVIIAIIKPFGKLVKQSSNKYIYKAKVLLELDEIANKCKID